MTKNTTQLQMNLSRKPSAQQSKRLNALSVRQQSDVERFHRIFPSEQEVLIYFSPAKWKAAIANANKCTCCSYMTLSMLNSTYSDGLAERLVENNMRGIYSMARPIDSINDNAVRQATGLFVGKFGAELSVFGALLYFAQYLTDHKNSYGQFDLMDVLRQCNKSFLPKWRQRLGQLKLKEARHMEGFKETGKAALYTYLQREYVEKGIDIRTSPLVQHLSLSEIELKIIESSEPLPL